MARPALSVRERIERGMSVKPMTWRETWTGIAALAFVLVVGAWLVVTAFLFIARLL